MRRNISLAFFQLVIFFSKFKGDFRAAFTNLLSLRKTIDVLDLRKIKQAEYIPRK
jgi:hypothetical protein